MGRAMAVAKKASKPTKSVSRSFRGLSAEERQKERRARLMEAGFSLFGTRGYPAVTVREVCAEAKLTERYFYESFDNLEVLFKTLYDKLHVELKQITFGAIARAARTPEAMAEASLRAFFQFVHEDPRRGRILLVDATSLGERMVAQTQGAINDYVELTRNLLVMLFPGLEAELKIDPGYIAQGLVGSLIFQFWRWASEGFTRSLEEVVASAMIFHRALSTYIANAQREHAEASKLAARPPFDAC